MKDQLENSANEISLVDIYRILMNHIFIIIGFVLVLGSLAAFYAYSIAKPMYRSQAYVLVQVQTDPTNTSFDLLNAQRLLATAKDLISMPMVLDEVIQTLGLDSTNGQLANGLTITSSETSYFISVSYLSDNPVLSKNVVNTLIDETINFANDNVPVLSNNMIRTSFAEDGVYTSPNRPLYVVVGVILGGILGIAVIFIKEMFDNTFKTKDQIENEFGIQVLGVIPKFTIKDTER